MPPDLFTTIRTEGALLPRDLLRRIVEGDRELPGLTPIDYHLGDEKLNEAINRSWNRLVGAWRSFQSARSHLLPADAGTSITRERWLLILFQEFGYGRLPPSRPIVVAGKTYPLSHLWGTIPIHLVGSGAELDQRTAGVAGAARASPHSLVQELLNRSETHQWGLVSNGLLLRVLRDNVSLTRQAFLEFDLEAMFDNDVYADFVPLWLICHQSRLETIDGGAGGHDCWLERWTKLASEQGSRALDRLRRGVEAALDALGNGFLANVANTALLTRLRSGALTPQDYYRQLLRVVYRLIFLFVAEDRELLLVPGASPTSVDRYARFYSTARIRRLAERHRGGRHPDLYRSLLVISTALGTRAGLPALGLPALGSFLWSSGAAPDLERSELSNRDFLEAVRALAFSTDRGMRHVIDYKNLGTEELGSVYESLLELHPTINTDSRTFALSSGGGERRSTGSYYTPATLIKSLLDSALDPVMAEAGAGQDAIERLLALKVVDPACGSGHFLIAAAHRIARRLAELRTGESDPPPRARRSALREVIGRCLHGVDVNEMAVELCKVALWIESLEPGKALSFLDHRILHGDSLIGATPALLANGIPDEAFDVLEGDDRVVATDLRRRNRTERERSRLEAAGQTRLRVEAIDISGWERFTEEFAAIDAIRDDDVASLDEKERRYQALLNSPDAASAQLLADIWSAAFFIPKTSGSPQITNAVFEQALRGGILPEATVRAVKDLARGYKFLHWRLAFPDAFAHGEGQYVEGMSGFDVVLGNPPWDKVKVLEQEWFGPRRPDIASAAATGRRRMIARLREEDPSLHAAFTAAKRQADTRSNFIRNSGRYPLCGRGDVNIYSVFAEHNRTVLSTRGRAGFIVPLGIATDDTTKYFFQAIVESKSLVSLFGFENEEHIFPAVHNETKFALLTLSGAPIKRGLGDFVFFARRAEDLADAARHFSLGAPEIRLLNPNTGTCPTFRSQRDAEINLAIYRRFPVLVVDGETERNPWNVKLVRMFDMTNDSNLFNSRADLLNAGWRLNGNVFDRDGEKCLPLYEGKMIWHFDHRFGTYEGQTQAQANKGFLPQLNEQQHADPDYFALPRYWVREGEMPPYARDGRAGFLGFRDVTGSVVLRTAIFCVLPLTACGNNLPLVLLDPSRPRDISLLGALFSSFVLDYACRQKVGGAHINFFILKQLAVPPPDYLAQPCRWDPSMPLAEWLWRRAIELTYTAHDLKPYARACGIKAEPFRWDRRRRELLRAEIDAALFHIYGLSREDTEYVIDTFRLVRQADVGEHGEFRTKRLVLDRYEALARAIATGVFYESSEIPEPTTTPSLARRPLTNPRASMSSRRTPSKTRRRRS